VFNPVRLQVTFVVDKVALQQVFAELFGLPLPTIFLHHCSTLT
jgi:hypothetical protein